MKQGAFRFAWLLLVCLPVAAQTVDDPRLDVDLWVNGITAPTTLTFVDDASILILEKTTGRVRLVVNGTLQPSAVLDVAVNAEGERGLVGIVKDPDFVNNGEIYLYYTESGTGADGGAAVANRVYRYVWQGNALVAPEMIVELPVEATLIHNAGVMAFGPDDRLHVAIGDLLRQGQLQNVPLGASPDDTGVILRVGRDGGALGDNPFFDEGDPSSPLNRYHAYGMRNTFGLAFDPLTGALWQTENGPSQYDEVNRVPAGFNGGWRQIAGPDERDPQGVADLWMAPGAVYTDPQFSWVDTISPTALMFVASRRMGCDLEHAMLVGGFNCGQLYRFPMDGARMSLGFDDPALADGVADNNGGQCTIEQAELIFGSGFGPVTDVENGPDGALYVVSHNASGGLCTGPNCPGAIYRVHPEPGTFTDFDGDLVDDACDCDSADATAWAAPAEIPRLRLSGDVPLTLGWDSQSVGSGAGTSYELVRGRLSELQARGGFDAACTAASGLTLAAASDPADDPPAGDGNYYLVRATNGCADGTFGAGRALLDAAAPASCP